MKNYDPESDAYEDDDINGGISGTTTAVGSRMTGTSSSNTGSGSNGGSPNAVTSDAAAMAIRQREWALAAIMGIIVVTGWF